MRRPRKEDSARRETVTVRMTAEEKRMLKYCAGKLGMTDTDVLISGIKIISGMIEKHQAGRETGHLH